MKRILKLGSVAVAAACLFAQPAMAHGFDRKEANGETVGAVLMDLGYRAKITTDNVGDPLVETTMDGTNVRIYFYNCNDSQTGCEDIQFVVGFDMPDGTPLTDIEEWNESKLYGTAYLDDENDPFLKLTVQVGPGGTPELVEGYISTFEAVMAQFKDHIGFGG